MNWDSLGAVRRFPHLQPPYRPGAIGKGAVLGDLQAIEFYNSIVMADMLFDTAQECFFHLLLELISPLGMFLRASIVQCLCVLPGGGCTTMRLRSSRLCTPFVGRCKWLLGPASKS